MQVSEEETGNRTGLWMVTVTSWVSAPTAERAAKRAKQAAEVVAETNLDAEVDKVVGWDLNG